MFFRKAVRRELLVRTPLEGVKAGSQRNRDRMHDVTPQEIDRLLEAIVDHDWRCIIALARWGGLRTPSETLRLRWEDVDWTRERVRVRSPKTEHHEGKGERVFPLCPQLHAVLLPAFEAASDGAEFVVAGYRDATAANLRTQRLRLIRRAGLEPWPRLFNALRASRATELAAEFPRAVCESWRGHTAEIARAHDQMVRECDFERAVTRGAQYGAAPGGTDAHSVAATDSESASAGSKHGYATGCGLMQTAGMGVTGLEPVTSAM